MGKKKPAITASAAGAGEEAIPAVQAGKKSKKKGANIDDDEYSIGTELSDDIQSEKQALDDEPPAAGKKKGKKGGSKAKPNDEDEDKEEAAAAAPFAGKKKPKSKKGGGNSLFTASAFDALEDDNDAVEPGKPDLDEDAPSMVFAGKKKSKGKKGRSAFDALEDDNDEVEPEKPASEDGEDAPAFAFSGKKKASKSSKKSNSVFTASILNDVDDDSADIGVNSINNNENKVDDGVPDIAFSGRKKSSKSSKKSNSFDVGLDDEDSTDVAISSSSRVEDEDDDATQISFSGKKKSSKSSKKNNSLFTGSAIEDDADGIGENQVENEASTITFSGKKKSSKSSKKSSSSTVTSGFDSVLGEEDSGVTEQPAMGGNISSSNEVGRKNDNDVKDEKQGSESVAEPSKKQKKGKKKSGRTAQEEDDLDKILAELGEGPLPPKPTAPPPPEEKVEVLPGPVKPVDVGVEEKDAEVEEKEGGESAAAKKKKKKKEKEKEKKAAAAAAVEAAKEEKQEETKSKISDKKLPKHVREMQEALARRKEAEERKKREEEEKLRREEEERRRLEEQERLAEEARRRKKEREKEKLLKKKQEGKLLTGKQKEEARRLEAMRNQFLASHGQLPIANNETSTSKRPKYESKKAKHGSGQGHGGAAAKVVETVEVVENPLDSVPDVEPSEIEKVEEESSVGDVEQQVVEENGVEEEDDDEEWDAKSWDDVDVALPAKSAFAEEEAESTVKKDTKRLTSSNSMNLEVPPAPAKPTVAIKKVAPQAPVKSHDADSKGEDHEAEEANEKPKRKEAAMKREQRAAEALLKASVDDLRSPICCILGHVDTGKTKLLDCIRGTNVQEGEAGGITQQIGATYFPAENIRDRTKELKADAKLRVPGLLVIDTPGHESFTNLRSRGSGLCDIAILVVDIMHGLEPQTIESLNLLKMRNTEFIVALNKVDRLYGWKSSHNAPIVKAMKQQSNDVQNEFKMRLTQIVTQFKEQGLNTELYYKNREMGETFSIVPTSAVTGEGIPDLLLLLVQWTQKTMEKKLMFVSEVQCTVLEVKVIEGLGTTIDVVLVNGVLHEGDQIVVCGMQGPIVTTIRALLTPHPMKELRVKGSYQHHKELKAAQGIKITAQGLEHAIAGTGLYVVGPGDDVEAVKEATMQDMNTVMSRIDKSGEGVCVQASTLGSLEALLEFLKSPAVNIPVSGISIGPVHKRDVMRASVMLERKKEYATILAFDVKVTPEARELAEETGVKIFIADIIYHLFDQFKAYIDNLKEEKKKEASEEAVFPCLLKIMPNCIFNKKDPIVLGVDILDGIAKVGTPICIPSRDFIDIGRVASIEINHKQVDVAKKGQKVAIKIVGSNSEEQQKMFGRHFEIDDELVSHISRRSIDLLKENYRDDLSLEEWKLVVKLKNLFKIQ
eukprot:TRINITY_DN1331_c1_g1_i1.p1 TRINITY_DN1331_c1_g1~~TRINITY_DN1331_c1_g1_i1.p1  ORF type:complete len:1407 (-),score=469.48 TRINITY_DN1331_c1_g1_i1:556-4776(-)